MPPPAAAAPFRRDISPFFRRHLRRHFRFRHAADAADAACRRFRRRRATMLFDDASFSFFFFRFRLPSFMMPPRFYARA